MNKADIYMKESIEKILGNGYLDVNPRPKYADGTPAHTLSINHVVRTYDLSKGEFPILTLRPIAIKTGIKEILSIYQNQSNKISEFERMGCGWWKDWQLEDGTIGKAYPYNLESHRPNEMKRLIKKVKCRYVDNKFSHKLDVPVFEGHESIDGEIYLNRYKVIGINNELTDNKHTYYNIQFILNNYVTYMRKDSIGISNGINPYERTVFGVGFLGEYKDVENFTNEEVELLMIKWRDMLRRCYYDGYKQKSKTYNDKFVHQDWHSFENFLRDVRYLPQYFLAREDNFKGWDLDKDYYGSNAYSKDTCVFLKHSENIMYSDTNYMYEIINLETGDVYYELTLNDIAKILNVSRQTIYSHIEDGEYKGFKINRYQSNKDYVYRYELSRNQVVELIKDIKNNPYGRRHIISFWHWANIDKKSLVECAYETIWNVRNDGNGNEYLDMCLIQRSGDMLTASGAGGINEVQYAALLMMIAKHTGYEAGVFTHFVANEQIYDRHIEQAKEMIERYNKLEMDNNGDLPNPKLILNTDKTNFYDITIDDFEMIDYNPIKPQISLPLGI